MLYSYLYQEQILELVFHSFPFHFFFFNRLKTLHNFTRFHFIGYSQSGLLGRSVLSLMENHGCENFISLAGPLSGVYGFHLLDNYFPNLELKDLLLLFYIRNNSKII
jgi:hypothetical protein